MCDACEKCAGYKPEIIEDPKGEAFEEMNEATLEELQTSGRGDDE